MGKYREVLHVEIQAAHKDMIREAAKVSGLNVAGFVRVTMIAAARKVLRSVNDAEPTIEFIRPMNTVDGSSTP